MERKITEEKKMKERFGNLGIYMINQARNEIKKMNQKLLFQKAEIKKKYREELLQNVQKSRDRLEEYSNNILNYSLSSTLTEINQKYLDLKLNMINKLYENVIGLLKKKIKENYSNYIKFLMENLKNLSQKLEFGSELEININTKDYEFFEKDINKSKLQKLFKKSIILKKTKCIGGFKLKDPYSDISYNNIIDDLISRNKKTFHIELSKEINDNKIEQIKRNFIEIIEKHRTDIILIKEQMSYNE
ncbi:MAG: hypothetical protein ACFFAS_19605 [Promethearchaeota archaeon]